MKNKEFSQRYIVKSNKDTLAGFNNEAEANKFAADKRVELIEEELCRELATQTEVDQHSTCARRIDEETVRVDILECLTDDEYETVIDALGDAVEVKSVTTGSDGRIIITISDSEAVWVEDQYESFARLLEQANKFPDSNETTFWRILLEKALYFSEYIPLSRIQQLQMSVETAEDREESGLPEGSIWVSVEAWSKYFEINFEHVVERAANETGYRLEDWNRAGETYAYLVVPANAE